MIRDSSVNPAKQMLCFLKQDLKSHIVPNNRINSKYDKANAWLSNSTYHLFHHMWTKEIMTVQHTGSIRICLI